MDLADVGAERAVLSAVWQGGSEVFDDVDDLVNYKTFTAPGNQALYRCFSHIFEEDSEAVVDYALVMSAAESTKMKGVLDREEKNYLRAVANMPTDPANARKLAAKIQKLEIARLGKKQMALAMDSIDQITGDEEVSHILGLMENPIYDFTGLLTDEAMAVMGPCLMSEGLLPYIQYLAENPVDQIGISTGFSEWDNAIGGGLRGATVNVFCARRKGGKTVLGDNMAVNICKQGYPGLNLDTEMSLKDHWHRILARLSGVTIREIETGQFAKDPQKKRALWQAMKEFDQLPYYYESISGQQFEDTLAMMRRWVKKVVGLQENGKANPCVIVFDYLKLMSPDSIKHNIAEYQAIGYMMTMLQNFMVRWEIPCIALAQLNQEEKVAQSDRISWYCSNLSHLLWKLPEEKVDDETDEHGQEPWNQKIIIEVARHGPGLEDGDYINVNFHRNCAKMTEGPKKSATLQKKPANKLVQDSGLISDDDTKDGIGDEKTVEV